MKTVHMFNKKKSWKLLLLLANKEVQTEIRKKKSCKAVQNSKSKKETEKWFTLPRNMCFFY